MKVPFLSFELMNADVKQDIFTSFENFFNSAWYIMGEDLKKFEAAYAGFCGTTCCTGVANGLDALIISLKTLGIGTGDEVIVPSNTYIATWLAVSYVGATPVPVEPRKETYNINPGLIEKAITTKTKAILPVHLYGQCCEMEAIMQVAQKYNLFVVEDNAQAQGATYKLKTTGSFGHINATSFYPGKNLGAYGDAGAITTNSEQLDERAAVIRNYGSQKKYYNEIKGVNSRLDEIQAGFLSVKLKKLNDWNRQRSEIAEAYTQQLAANTEVTLPIIAENATSVFHQYVIRTEKRDALQQHLNEAGIGTMIHYPVPPHLQQAYTELNYQRGDFPIAEEIANTCLSLPIYPGLDMQDINYICETISKFFRNRR